MKILLNFLLILLSCAASAQLFGPNQELSDFLNSPSDAVSMDVDQDGDLDLLVLSVGDNKICWYPNLGPHEFGEQIVISTHEDNSWNYMFSEDIDGDGLSDLILLHNGYGDGPRPIHWMKNLGSGSFNEAVLISEEEDEFDLSLYFEDIENDGDLDLLTYKGGDEIGLYLFDQNTGFGPRLVLSSTTLSDCHPDFADIDQDGDIDLVTGHRENNTVHLLLNDGTGQFGMSQLLYETASSPEGLVLGDFDTDSDIDVLISSYIAPLEYIENQGSGTFTGSVQNNNGYPIYFFSRMRTLDMDSDGDLDLVGIGGDAEWLGWLENDGSGNFLTSTLSEHPWVSSFELADFSGDGQNELILARSGSAYADFPELIWDSTGERIGNYDHTPSHSLTTDFNGDGLEDLITLAISFDRILFHPNNGNGTFDEAQLLFQDSDYQISSGNNQQDIAAADMDGDQDMDLLFVSYDHYNICWFENDGTGNIVAMHCFDQDEPGAKIRTADIDSDGDMDVVLRYSDFAGFPLTVHSRVLLNDGNGDLSTSSILDTQSVNTYAIGDLNSDGSPDLVATGYQIFETLLNDGTGNFTHTSVSPNSGSSDVTIADLDSDGDMDILERYGWLENDGTGEFSPTIPYSTSQGNDRLSQAADLDADGDMDLIIRSNTSISWMENDGQESFSAPQLIADGNWGPRGIHLIDIEQDGDLDLISRWNNQRILLSSNLSLQAGCPEDINGDGQVDINDFIAFNSAFNSTCSTCPEDIDGNGIVDIDDFLAFNSLFGVSCD